VIKVLAAMALVPDLAVRQELATSNARLELLRAVAALAAPVVAGFLAERAMPHLGFALASLAAACAAAMALTIARRPAAAPTKGLPIAAAIREGAGFAIRHDLLRGIVLCALCWNFSFFALMAVTVPYAMQRVGLGAAATGLVQSGYGLGLILGAALAGHILRRFEPRLVLVAGPALSVIAALLLLGAPRIGASAAFGGFLLIGFGPMLWLVCQTSVRQLVTPTELLGRVAALMQVAIYGVRPLGALAGGAAASIAGLDAAMTLVLVGFSLSLAVPLTSALGRLRVMPAQAAA
jgi:predicted MFS family arabinose efflux permease